MNGVTLDEALGAAVLVALEGLCFVSADGFAPKPTTDEPTITSTISFRGPGRGVVAITVPRALLPVLFGDVLDDADHDACLDALGELANIVCGGFVPRAFGAAVYELAAPRLADVPTTPPTAGVIVRAAGKWVSATLHVEGAVVTRVLIVDDSAAFRMMLRRALASSPDLEVVGEAADPFEARTKIAALRPDVVTLDVHMPRMDGAEFLRHLMRTYPLPVVVITGDAADRDLAANLRAAGAAAVIEKPGTGGREAFHTRLVDTIRKLAGVQGAGPAARPVQGPSLIAIGASTGGMNATAQLLAGFGRSCPPIVVTQHVDAIASDSLTWLAKQVPMKVREARAGEALEPGLALFAPYDRHLRVVRHDRRLVAHLTMEDRVQGHRPSVDILFQSLARIDLEGMVAVLLTGMGTDGASGLLELRKRGARTIVQDPADCVVAGMPEAAMRSGAAERIVRLADIARTALQA